MLDQRQWLIDPQTRPVKSNARVHTRQAAVVRHRHGTCDPESAVRLLRWSGRSARSTMAVVSADNETTLLRPVLTRFAPGWPRSVYCGEGWWPITADLDR
jgi:hypothetical protein